MRSAGNFHIRTDDRPPVPSVGGAVGTAARGPAPAGQLVIVIGELRGGVAALAAVSPRVVKCASSRADRLGKVIREPSERSRVQSLWIPATYDTHTILKTDGRAAKIV